jgi:hypothetical protein
MAAALVVLVPSWSWAAQLDLTETDWSLSPSEVSETTEGAVQSNDWRDYARRSYRVQWEDATWERFFVFHDGSLLAHGYEKAETPTALRVGTISDVVSYDNEYSMATALTGALGEPHFKDVRTRAEFSQEMGDPKLRARRAVEWDLLGERLRWHTDDAIVRYAVRYSLKGQHAHRAVAVKDGHSSAYLKYLVSKAFRDAGLQIIRQFQVKSKETVVAISTPSGQTVKAKVETGEKELVPKEPEKDSFTVTNCSVQGHDCSITFHTYGGHVYRMVIDVPDDGSIGRRQRGGFEKAAMENYKRYKHVHDKLGSIFGEPTVKREAGDLTNDRNEMKVHRLTQGMEAFFGAWYAPSRDVLIRHAIMGDSSGTSWHVDHRVTLRLHSVSRAFAVEEAWSSEAKKAKAAKRRRAEKASESEASDEGSEGSDSKEAGGESNSE